MRPTPLRHRVCHIVPPFMLDKLVEREDVRKAAVNTLIVTARLRTQRQFLSQLLTVQPGGGLRRTIFSAQNDYTLPGNRVRGEGEPPNADSNINEAYDGLGATHQLYDEVYKRNSIDDRGMRLDAVVHYGVEYNNAMWNGAQMVFGDGDGKAFVGFTQAVDVIGHELTHGVTGSTAALEYHFQPGALNESFSDVFGSLVKQRFVGQDASQADWLIGAGILGPEMPGKALRSMKDPGTAFKGDPQPGHMSKYVDRLPDTDEGDYGGVHINSGIPNKAFYLAATNIGGNAWDDAGHIWYDTLTKKLWATATFVDCASATIDAAGELFGSDSDQQKAVADAWGTVGVTVPARPLAKHRKAATSDAKRRPQRPLPRA